jgi:hypothetical protein
VTGGNWFTAAKPPLTWATNLQKETAAVPDLLPLADVQKFQQRAPRDAAMAIRGPTGMLDPCDQDAKSDCQIISTSLRPRATEADDGNGGLGAIFWLP